MMGSQQVFQHGASSPVDVVFGDFRFVAGFVVVRAGVRSFQEGVPDSDAGEDEGSSLEDLSRDEHEVPRQRLRDELKREPSEEELNDWLRRHTEGY